jgi:predicted outer membrane repeat protein
VLGNSARGVGGGVAAVGRLSAFTLESGAIRENRAEGGGGVAVYEGCSFVMLDGLIEDNQSTVAGGGLVLNRSASLLMKGGRIGGNVSGSGGGLALIENCSLTLSGGEISANSAREHGGGIASDETSSITVEGGLVAGNSAGSFGGGVFSAGRFIKSAGVIRGSDAIEKDSNTAESGASLYLSQYEIAHENTLNEGDTVDSAEGEFFPGAEDEGTEGLSTGPLPPSPDSPALVKAGVLSVGMEAGCLPMEYFEADGSTLAGFDVELAEALAAKLGWKIEFVDRPWSEIFSGLNEGAYDCIISAAAYTWEPEPDYNYTKPYFAIPFLLVVRRDSEHKPEGLEELRGLTVGCLEPEERFLLMCFDAEEKTDLPFALYFYSEYQSCVRDLDEGLVDVVLIDALSAFTFAQGSPEDIFRGLPFEISAGLKNYRSADVFTIFLKKGNDALTGALDRGLDELHADGTLGAISGKFFGIATFPRGEW